MKQKIITKDKINEFKKHLIEDEKSQATIEKYMRDIEKLCDFLKGAPIDKMLMLAYKQNLSESYTKRSANSMIAAANSLFRFLGWYEICVKQFKIQNEAYCSEEKELTKREYQALVSAAKLKRNERLALIIQTICSTGIRVGELSFMTVESAKKGEAVVSLKGKTRKIFLVLELRKKLIKYAEKQGIKSGAIFITKGGKPMDRSNIWREMKSLCESAGVSHKKVFPHNLRHLFARTFYAIDKDIAKLADILGHTNINTTRIYIITTGAEHRRKMENMRLII